MGIKSFTISGVTDQYEYGSLIGRIANIQFDSSTYSLIFKDEENNVLFSTDLSNVNEEVRNQVNGALDSIGDLNELNTENRGSVVSAINGLNRGILVASSAALMTNTGAIYRYVGTEDGYEQNALYYYNGTAWVTVLNISEYVKFTDIFGDDTNGVVPHRPWHFVQQGGQYPTFGYMRSIESEWTVSYEPPNVSIYGAIASRPERTDPKWLACFSGLTHIIGSSSKTYAIATSGGQLYTWNPHDGTMYVYAKASISARTTTDITFPANVMLDMTVTKESITVVYNEETYTIPITLCDSSLITHASFGFFHLNSETVTGTFQNAEVGEFHYEYDNSKFLKSNGEWSVPATAPEGLPTAFKDALLGIFREVAYVSDEAQSYYDALRVLLYPPESTDEWTSGVAYSDLTVLTDVQINDGLFNSESGWNATDMIPCNGVAYITFPQLHETAMEANHAAFYNQARDIVSTFTLGLSAAKDITVPSGAAFFAVSSEAAALTQLINDGIVPHA